MGDLRSYLDSLLAAIGPFKLHFNFIVVLKDHHLHLPYNEVQLRDQFPVHIFLAFSESPLLPTMQWSKKTVPRLPLHQISRKASEQVIWLRIPHLLGEIPNQIICSLGRLRLRLRRVKACQKDFWRIYDLGSLLVAIKPFQLHLIFKVFLKGHFLYLFCNEVKVRPQFPLHIFLVFWRSYIPHLPSLIVSWLR